MLVKVFGVLDIALGIFLIFVKSLNLPVTILIIFGIILLFKSSLGLLKDFACWIDFLAGIIFILSTMISIPTIICIISGLLLLQKGIFSFL